MAGISIIDTFEGADGSALTTATDRNISTITLLPSGGSTANYSASDAVHGASGVRFTTALNGSSAVQYLTPDNQYQFSTSVWLKTPSSPMTGNTNIEWFYNTNGHHGLTFCWRYNSASDYGFYIGDGANKFLPVLVNTAVLASTWYRVTITTDLTSATSASIVCKMYDTGGNVVGSASTATGNGGGYPIQYLFVGIYGTASPATSIAMDDFQLVTQSTAELPAYNPAPNQPPVVSAGGPYTTAVGVPITLVGTATDTDGSVASVQWSAQDWPGSTSASPPPPPFIGNASASNASLTPGTPGVYRVKFTATDNLNASSSATATLYVTDVTANPIATTANYGWNGTVDVLSDGSDNTYVESPASAPSGSSYITRLAPLNVPDSFNLTIRAYLSASNPGATVTVNLLEGTTVRKSWTISPTLAPADYILSMTTAEIQTVGSWNTLDVQVVWQTPI